jgi:hypothetical protein
MSNPSTIEEILAPHGYEIRYDTREKYRGSSPTKLCIAMKGGTNHYAFKISLPDSPDHHQRIQRIQEVCPRVAKMVGPIEDVILSVEAPGHNLWEIGSAPDPDMVEAQLIEFALWGQRHELIHGDLRPWNIFFDQNHGVQVIDWREVSAFVDDLLPRDGQSPRRYDLLDGQGHYTRFHRDLVAQGNFTQIDLRDAQSIGKLLRGEVGLTGAWPDGSIPSWRPPWCSKS